MSQLWKYAINNVSTSVKVDDPLTGSSGVSSFIDLNSLQDLVRLSFVELFESDALEIRTFRVGLTSRPRLVLSTTNQSTQKYCVGSITNQQLGTPVPNSLHLCLEEMGNPMV